LADVWSTSLSIQWTRKDLSGCSQQDHPEDERHAADVDPTGPA
jgi:hypothetical protein